jgi:holin-like protein
LLQQKEGNSMKYVKQLFLILFISFLGEILKYVLPFPVPASIYGLLILFICLETGWLKLGSVEETAKYLVEIMPLMFIPAGVGLLDSWGALQPVLLKIAVITVISTIVVMIAAGRVTQCVIRMQRRKEEEGGHE